MFFSKGRVAYNEDDCPKEEKGSVRIEYDSRGIGRVVHNGDFKGLRA